MKLCEVLNDNDSFRFDSEFFKKEYLEIDLKIHQHMTEKLGKLSVWVTQGPNPIFTQNGIHCLTGRNVKTGTVDYNDSDFVDLQEYKKLKRFQIQQNDILITLKGKGSIGKIGFVTEVQQAIFSRDIGLIRINSSKIKQAFINTFLITKFGSKIIEKGETGGTGQSTLTTSYIKNISIPIFRETFQTHIETLVLSAHQKLEQSKQLYQSAEAMLLKELGFDDFSLTCNNVAIKSLSESFSISGRLDAEYYQPKYDAILEKIQSYRGGFDLVKNLFTQNKTSYVRNKKSYYYIEISDINVSNGEIIPNEILVEELPDNAKIKVSKGDILVSKVRPYRGAVGIVDENDKDLICSGAFTVLKEKGKILKETLVILFRLSYYKDLLLKYNVGTSYPVIKDEDILNLPIPFIDEVIQQNIASNIQKSFALRSESKQLLAKAKAAVECAIEQGEAYAINTFLHDH